MKTKILPFVLLLTILQTSAFAQYVDIRLSIKVILNPTNSARPAGVNNALFYAAAESSNEWMARYWRGYRFRVTEVLYIGGPSEGGTNGPSKWWWIWNDLGIDMRDQPYWGRFQSDTKTNNLYRLRNDQVNFYVIRPATSGTGGACPIPPGEVSDTACVGLVNDGPFWLVHETGHFFGLSHTHGGCGCPSTSGCSLMNGYWVGDDGIADTLPEGAGDFCFTTRDHISRANFNKFYTNCTPSERFLVDNTYFNVMSYHNPNTKDQVEDVMTELQLDGHADTAGSYRAAFVSGHTWFARPGIFPSGSGSSTDEYQLLSLAINAADSFGGDLVALRPGSYNQQLTISKPVTLRATRAGWATIGK
ncbi:MAG TPA: hypothetical protein VK615_15570 [Candidatus Binatia bacterium]|nr:hypothetical protein [Candidatus Binatia bacterium]